MAKCQLGPQLLLLLFLFLIIFTSILFKINNFCHSLIKANQDQLVSVDMNFFFLKIGSYFMNT